MKRVLFLLLGFNLIAFAQVFADDPEWYEYEFDDLVTVTMPGDVYERDTTVQGRSIFQFEGYNGNSVFVTQRIPVIDRKKKVRKEVAPFDKESLIVFYENVVEGFTEAVGPENFSGKEIGLDGLIGYEFEVNTPSEAHLMAGRIFVLEDSAYIFTYANVVNWDDAEKDYYFNTINVINPGSIDQFRGEKPELSAEEAGRRAGTRIGQILFFVAILVGGAIVIRSVVKNRRHRKRVENTPWHPPAEFRNPPPPTPSPPVTSDAHSPESSTSASPEDSHSSESPSEPSSGPDEPPPLPPR